MRHQGGLKTEYVIQKRGGFRSALGVLLAFTIASAAGAAGATYGPSVCEGGSGNLACSNVVSRLLVGEDVDHAQPDLVQSELAAGVDGNRLDGPHGLGNVGSAVARETPGPVAQEVAATQAPEAALDANIQPARQEAQNAQATDTERPSVPRGLRVQNSGSTAAISWIPSTDNVGVAGYEIYRSAQDGQLGVLAGRSVEPNFNDGPLTRGVHWYYIKSVDATGNTSWRTGMKSVEIFNGVTNDGDKPTTPMILEAAVNGSSVALSWTESTDATSPVTSYSVSAVNIYGVQRNNKVSTTTSIVYEGFAAGTYWLSVQAIDESSSRSSPSEAIRVTITDGVIVDTERPSVPTNLSVLRGGTSALLNWTASTDNDRISHYNLYRSTQQGKSGVLVGNSGSTSFDDDQVPFGTHWYYIKAEDVSGNLSWRSGMVPVTIDGGIADDEEPPGKIASVQALVNPGTNNVTVSWGAVHDNVGVDYYQFFRKTKGANTAVQLPHQRSTSFVDVGVPDGEYVYYGWAVDLHENQGDVSNFSPVVRIGPPPDVDPPQDSERPSTPTGLSVASVGATEVSLSWGASTDNVGVARYLVIDEATGAMVATSTGANATVSGLTAGTSYSFFVKTEDAAGNRSWRSNIRTLTTTQ